MTNQKVQCPETTLSVGRAPIGRLFEAAAESFKSEAALLWPGGRLTYAELLAASTPTMTAAAGLPPTALLVLGGGNVAETVVRIVGCWRAGRLFAIVGGDWRDTPGTSRADIELSAVGTGVGVKELDGDVPREASVVLQTSGTTGSGRFVVHSSQGVLAGLDATLRVQAELLGVDGAGISRPTEGELRSFRTGVCFGSGMMPWTMAGYTILQRALLVGDTLAFMRCQSVPDFGEDQTEFGATAVGLPALMAQKLARTPPGVLEALPAPISLGIGGSRVPPAVCEVLERRFNAIVTVGYGSTELGGPVLMARPDDPAAVRWSTVGRPLPAVDVRLEPSTGQDSDSAELWVRSPSLALGYLSGAGIQRQTRDWYRTGDSAADAGDGRIRVTGRIDHVLIRGGRLFDLSKVQDCLSSHPGVEAVGVLGVPSRVAGEEDLGVVLVPATDDPPSVLSLRAWLATRAPGYPPLRRMRVVDSLPVAADGNQSVTALRALFGEPSSNPAEGAC